MKANYSNKLRKANVLYWLILSLISSIGTAYAGFNYTYTPIPSNFYTAAASVGEIKSKPYGTDMTVATNATGKFTFIIPPGVDQFYIANMTVNKWNCGSSPLCLYDHSMTDKANAEDYALQTSTGYSAYFIHTVTAPSVVSNTPSATEKRGYFIVKNTGTQEFRVVDLTLTMRISDLTAYNNWVASSAPSSSSSSSGGGGSTSTSSSSTSSSSTSSSSTSSSSSSTSSGGSSACGGFTGIPCTGTSSSTSSSSSGGDDPVPAPVPEEPTMSQVAVEIESTLSSSGFVGGSYSEDSKYVYWNVASRYDFNDGNGKVDTKTRVKVLKEDYEAFKAFGYHFDKITQANPIESVSGYKLWAMYDSTKNPETTLILYPSVENRSALEEKLLKFSNVISASVSDKGVIYVITDDYKVHRGVLNHNIIQIQQSAPSGSVLFDSVKDLNGDGYNDYKIVYDNGYMQYLYYIPPPTYIPQALN